MAERDVTPSKLPFTLKPALIIIAIIVLAVIVAGTSSVFVVDQTEKGVVLRFGKYNRTVGPGLQGKLPFGLEKSYLVKTEIVQTQSFGYRTVQAGVQTRYSQQDYPNESVMLTGDLAIINVEWVIQYRITDPYAWLFNVSDTPFTDPSSREVWDTRVKTIRDISQSVINRLVGDRASLDIVGRGSTGNQNERTTIEEQGKQLMNEYFQTYKIGVSVLTVQLQNTVPPEGDVQNAFEDVNKAEQDMERSINEGRASYNAEIPKARGQAQQVIQQAQGYAAERVNNAKGDVARFNSVLTEYRRAPATTRERLYLETMEQVFQGDTGTTLVDKGLSNFIPLMNLQQPSGSSATSAQSTAAGGTK